NGASQWITSPEARADGQAWRARACAVLTGIGTVLADNPRLDVREVPTTRQPQLVVLDSRLRTPPNAQLFVADRPTTICAGGHFDTEFSARQAVLEARGATVLQLRGADDRVDLPALLRALGARGINELHVEAGHRLNGALLRAGLVDELLLYLAPKLLGPGRGMADIGPLHALSEGVALEWRDVQRIGPDLRVLARVAGRDRF
ncbi:MAG: RibD family protein, partial [Giesbergeria sp.]|nr:RibD family protein [Giesbergeria sp.]